MTTPTPEQTDSSQASKDIKAPKDINANSVKGMERAMPIAAEIYKENRARQVASGAEKIPPYTGEEDISNLAGR